MFFTKLTLTGHVHNQPERVITSSVSVPLGTYNLLRNAKIQAFSKAFTLTSILETI